MFFFIIYLNYKEAKNKVFVKNNLPSSHICPFRSLFTTYDHASHKKTIDLFLFDHEKGQASNMYKINYYVLETQLVNDIM